jgi:hypothetical protein
VLEIRGVGVENDELYIDGSAKVMVMSKKKSDFFVYAR